MSGERRSARLKRRTRSLRQITEMIDRLIDPRRGKFHLQRRWRRRQRVADGGGGHADRAEVVGMVVRGLVLALTAVGCRQGRNQRAGLLGSLSAKAVNVTEGQRQVDGK